MKKLYLLLILTLGLQAAVWAQPTFTIDDTSADPGGTVSVNFKVKDFTNIIGMQFSINWDPSVLSYKSISNFSNTVRDFDMASFNTDSKFINIGQMVCQWFDMSTEPNTVPDGTILFTVEFDVVGAGGSSTTVTIGDEPRKIEVIDNNEADIGLKSEGGSFTATGTGGASLQLIGSDEVGASGEDVCVEISVRNFDNITGMQFSLNWDQTFLTYTGVGAFNLNGLSEGSFNADNVSEGKLVLQWLEPGSSGITLANDTRIFHVCFNITGTSGSRTVQFSDDPVAIEIVEAGGMGVQFSQRPGSVTVDDGGGGGNGGDCMVDGFALVADKTGGDPGSEVCVGISVQGFNDISSAASTIEWDPAILSNPRISGINLSGLAEGNFNLDQGANGMLSFVWFDPATDGITLSDGSEIFEICFDAIGSLGQSTTVVFSDALSTREAGNDDGMITFNQCDGSVTMGDAPGGNISSNVTSPTCRGETNGSINITVDFGSAPYSFEWTRGGTIVATTEDINGIGAGTYIVKVTDGAGMEETLEVIVADPSGAQITNVDITDATDGANGAIALTVTGNGLSYSWSNGATTRDIAGLEGGSYSLTITEPNGCTIDTAFAVGGGEFAVEITNRDFNGSGVSCNGERDGSLTAVASGGTGPYTYQWDDGSTDATRAGVGAGEYSVTVTDGAGDQVNNSITINEPDVLRVNVSTTPSPNGVEGTAEAVVSGGTEPYTYTWNDKTPPSTTRLIISLDVGTYTVVVSDANGCTASGSGIVSESQQECFTGRLVITPNDDSKNDFFSIACIAGTDNELEIYDRQGELVYEAANYNNDWFGLDRNGDRLPDGAYFWIVRVRLSSGLEQHTGHLTIIRDLN